MQGVGFRPTVWRLAVECRLGGDVRNDGEGVLVRVGGEARSIDQFCQRLREECPPLGRIDSLDRIELPGFLEMGEFRILASDTGAVHTGIVPDAAICNACSAEISDPTNRRYRYPFTNCTHCGPRLSILKAIPYDRANTSMSGFTMCADCRKEYDNPADRRFHAQPNACGVCGPHVWLENAGGDKLSFDDQDTIAAASRLLMEGHILAIKGIGGFHLACDACNERSVSELRARKRRYGKPFALMARDIGVIRHYCEITSTEAELLGSTAAPVMLLDLLPECAGSEPVARAVAPGQRTLGFMLPYSPLHQLLLAHWDRPLVMTSANLSEEPQCIDNTDAAMRLRGLADYLLLNDRDIVNRVDDSVVRVMGHRPRILRRARGYAPASLTLPEGFERVPQTLALGGELKNTICLIKDGAAILSQHLGDLEDARTASEYEQTIELYRALFQHEPECIAADLHPDYWSTGVGQLMSSETGLDLIQVQHHFAHTASVLADQGWPLDGGPVIGVVLDGLGFGDDGTLWGGEFLLADYRGYHRLAHLTPAPMPGGTQAIRQPWRNTYAQLVTHMGWAQFNQSYSRLELAQFLRKQPLHVLDAMVARRINSPQSSSCGRLFDAVAAALGLCRESVSYEGQAAIELESLARSSGARYGEAYPFGIGWGMAPLQLSPAPAWNSLLNDLSLGVDHGVIAARFHMGLAVAVSDLAVHLAQEQGVRAIALSGGVFQNKTLFEAVDLRVRQAGLQVLSHERVPTNDGGLALGQAVIASARSQG